MTEKWTNFYSLFFATLKKYGAFFPYEEDMHKLLESLKEAQNDDIDHSQASLQEKSYAKSSNELFYKNFEQAYRQCRSSL